jgi:hypothetical protein
MNSKKSQNLKKEKDEFEKTLNKKILEEVKNRIKKRYTNENSRLIK